MAIYYYTPFKSTDDNERATWNLCLQWGAAFADCAAGQAPLDPKPKTVSLGVRRKFITPVELADKLVADGLPNDEVNVLLVVCFGGGPNPNAPEYPEWAAGNGAAQGYAKVSIAQAVARSLGGRQGFRAGAGGPWQGRVGGFAGPTYTKGGSFQVTLPGNAGRDDAWSYVHWFDGSGSPATPHRPNGFAAGKGAAGLSGLRRGDQLRVMGHGDWKGGGRILPFPGEGQEDLQSMEVDRPARLAGKSDDRVIVNLAQQTTGTALAKKRLQGYHLLLVHGAFYKPTHAAVNRVVVANDGGVLDLAICDKDKSCTYMDETALPKKKAAIGKLKSTLDPKWPTFKGTEQYPANDAWAADIAEQVGVILGWKGTEL